MPRICSIEGCDRKHYAKGHCAMHYKRLNAGSPMDALPLKVPAGEPERYIREVVLPYTGAECLIWPYGRSAEGRVYYRLEGVPQCVSRYVCRKVNGEPEGDLEAAHSCGNGNDGCVSPKHLSWKTPKGNAADKLDHGTFGSKITKETAIEIYSLKDKVAKRELARRYNVNKWTIKNILEGRSWVAATGATPPG